MESITVKDVVMQVSEEYMSNFSDLQAENVTSKLKETKEFKLMVNKMADLIFEEQDAAMVNK